jgi:tetratricopeptide (TPR) repeat protein
MEALNLIRWFWLDMVRVRGQALRADLLVAGRVQKLMSRREDFRETRSPICKRGRDRLRYGWQFALPVILLTVVAGIAQDSAGTLELGKVIERVTTMTSATQSYAVYLPSTYDPARKYPAIYAFDASGRGARAAGIYAQAAEKYGYLVFASNNSRNGQDGPTLSAALNAIWNDTNGRFSIDPKRVLATGNSGGGRVASLFAYSCRGCAFGVIGAGAGFSQGVPVDRHLPFLFLATAGSDDFNYMEVRELEKKLNKAGVVNHLIVFAGGHQWPPPAVVDRALAWYELQQMKFGRRAKDEVFIDNMFRQRIAAAEQLLAEGDLVGAGYGFKSIAADFKDLRAITDVVAKIDALERSADYRRAVNIDEDEVKQQVRVVADVMSVLMPAPNAPAAVDPWPRTLATIAKLRDRSAAVADSSERRVARRVLNDLFVRTFETALYSHERARDYRTALLHLQIAAEASPKFAAIPYNQARICALVGDKKKAIVFLRKAVELGFNDRGGIAVEKAFDGIRQEEEFVKAITAPIR